MTVEDRVIKSINKAIPSAFKSEDLNYNLKEVGLDSLKLVSVVTELCIELNIDLMSFDDNDLIGLETGNDLLKLLTNKN